MSHVAGHGDINTDSSGNLVIKKALPAELEVYEAAQDGSSNEPLATLANNWLPSFHGTTVNEQEGGDCDRALVLADLTASFEHPNVLDVKLGNVFHEPDATPIKKAKMVQQAITSTSWETGIRLTGFKHDKQDYWTASKTYGRTLRKDTLPKGIAAFFPDGPHVVCALVTARDQLEQIIQAVSSVEYRFVGSSLLVVYEGGRALVRLIDFGRARATPGEGPDEGVLLGLRNFHLLLQERIDKLSMNTSH